MIRPSVIVSLLIACAAVTPSARADRGLTAVGRVRPIGPGPTLSAALASGYGFTGDVLAADDSHHRASGALAPNLRVSTRLASTVVAPGSIDGASAPGSHTPRRTPSAVASSRAPPAVALIRGSPTKPSSATPPVWRS